MQNDRLPSGELWIERKQTLTEADLLVIESIVRKLIDEHHLCKIDLTHEQLDDVKRLSKFFNIAESAIVKTISKTILWVSLTVVGGIFWLLYKHGYFLGGR